MKVSFCWCLWRLVQTKQKQNNIRIRSFCLDVISIKCVICSMFIVDHKKNSSTARSSLFIRWKTIDVCALTIDVSQLIVLVLLIYLFICRWIGLTRLKNKNMCADCCQIKMCANTVQQLFCNLLFKYKVCSIQHIKVRALIKTCKYYLLNTSENNRAIERERERNINVKAKRELHFGFPFIMKEFSLSLL